MRDHSWNNLVQTCSMYFSHFPVWRDQHPWYHRRSKSWRNRVCWSADSPPHMNFEWMLRFRLALCKLVRHSEACTTIRMGVDQALGAENHVVESFTTLYDALSELQTLGFVGVTNQLPIGGPLQSPALLLLQSLYRGRTNENFTFCQLLSDLLARPFVIPTHLLIYESSCFHRPQNEVNLLRSQ